MWAFSGTTRIGTSTGPKGINELSQRERRATKRGIYRQPAVLKSSKSLTIYRVSRRPSRLQNGLSSSWTDLKPPPILTMTQKETVQTAIP